ncbi:MAG: DUF3696 domain-containing protein [Chthoniobacteraceae bacterium]
MITRLHIQNFKTWQDTGSLRLAPITIFFGGNSSGKSSIGQFLLMLRRTVEQPDRNMVLSTTDDQTLMHLGNYSDYVFDGGVKRNVVFELGWDCIETMQNLDRGLFRRRSWSCMEFHAKIGQLSESDRVASKEFFYVVPEPILRFTSDDGTTRNRRMPEMQMGMRRAETGDKYRLVTEQYEAKRRLGRAWSLPAPNRFYGFPEELYAYYRNVSGFSSLQLEFERMLKSIQYLGPLRQYPKPSYTWAGQSPSDVGFQGENTVAALLSGSERRFNVGGRAHYSLLQATVARWLVRLGVAKGFEVECASKTTHTYRTMLKMPGQSKLVALPSVGFGVSQVLPVVTQAFYAPPHSTIIIEQPELHLHPAVQSELADLFVEAIHSKEDSIKRNVQFLIESHSEHFLRRLQLRLADGTLAPDEVAVYFCEAPTEDSGSRVRSLEVDGYGRIKNWPKNFFGDPMTDIAATRKAGLSRQIAEEKEMDT